MVVTADADPPHALVMRAVTKRFGGVRALGGVDLCVRRGEVHALVGENGAGKSTLMKILAGALTPDSGSLELEGQPYRPRDPLAARERGIAMIHQELSLAPDLSVEANIMLGRERQRFGVISRAASRDHVREVLAFLNQPALEPQRKVAELGPGARQLVEVARALASDARLVVMDEPTSSLPQPDVERLLAVIERLATRGVSVVYISHALEELERIAQRYTVLRDGQCVKTGAMRETTRAELIEAMVGRSLDEAYPQVGHTRGQPLLELRELAAEPLPAHVNLTVHRGEIFGIAGLIGAGRTELLRALYGLAPIRRGTIKLGGVVDRGRPPWIRLAQRVGLLSEARKEEGLALSLSVADNLTLPRLPNRCGVLRRDAQRELTQRWIERLRVRCDDPGRAVGSLSGGNQQKIALARLLCSDAELLLLDEPTRGIDVGSKAEIHRLIGELARDGKAVLLVSSHLPELLGMCDRIAVMRRGQLGEARPRSGWSEAELMREATGVA
jgi:ribose transport system ATP-binding protein